MFRWWSRSVGFCVLSGMAAGGCLPLKAQWKAVCTKQEWRDTIFDARKYYPAAFRNSFYFPEYSYVENLHALEGAMDCADSPDVVVLRAVIPPPAASPAGPLILYSRVYGQNVRYFTWRYFNARERVWRLKKTYLPFNGYQIPTSDIIDRFDTVSGTPGVYGADENEASDRLLIEYTAADPSLPSRLVIGDMLVAAQKEVEIPVRHPFFDQIGLSRSCGLADPAIVYPTLSSGYFAGAPTEMVKFDIAARINIVRNGNCSRDSSELELLKRFVEASVENYPYFGEHGLDKRSVLDSLRRMLDDPAGQDYCLLAEKAMIFIRYVFSDLHYYLELPDKGPCALRKVATVKPPVRIADMNGDIRIAAGFDSMYRTIHLDDEVVSVDGIPVESICDSVSRSMWGLPTTDPYKRFVVVNALLDRNSADSCVIGTRRIVGGDVSLTVLHYNRPYRIPENFRPQHAAFGMIDGTAYFQIVYWEDAVYTRLVNHWDELSKVGSLVIDLRGNGGGDLISAMELFSLFIDKPRPFFHYVDKDGKEEPLLINPDPHFRLPAGMKVIILGDQSTACASEAFIRAMQGLKHTWLMGAGRTAGAIAARYDISLPEGLILHVNCLSRKICFNSRYDDVESKGIEPDLRVGMGSVMDLKPYNNKLLHQALKFLSADSRVVPKTDQ